MEHIWGLPAIAQALGFTTRPPVYRLHKLFGLPIIKRRHGQHLRWYTTNHLLDAWWLAMAQQQRVVWMARTVRKDGGRKSGTASRPATPSEAV